jgi:hypothetical protein
MPSRYVQNKQVIQSAIGDEVVMLDMESGFYFGLNTIASAIWQHLKEPIGWDELIDLLTQTYDVDRDVCETDTRELIGRMLEKGIIRELE